MNIIELGAIGEFLGGILVLVSILYLGRQVQQSNRHAEASTELSWIVGLNDIWDRWAAEPTMAAIRKGMRDFESLSKNEQVLFQMQVGALINHCMTADQLWARRLIARETREAAIDVLARVLQTPGGRRYWGFDSQASPDAPALMREIENHATGPWNELFPWWNDESRNDEKGRA